MSAACVVVCGVNHVCFDGVLSFHLGLVVCWCYFHVFEVFRPLVGQFVVAWTSQMPVRTCTDCPHQDDDARVAVGVCVLEEEDAGPRRHLSFGVHLTLTRTELGPSWWGKDTKNDSRHFPAETALES